MFDMARRLERDGKKIYHFEVGQPDFSTPENVVKAGIEALKQGFTRYTPARGIPPLLDAIEGSYKSRGIDFDGSKNVIVTPGAKLALFAGILATIDAGDDVLLLAPAWPTYRVMIRMVNAKPVNVYTNGNYTLDEEYLKQKISRTVSALVINSPNNPTGGILTKADLKLIYDLADKTMERTLVINGLSKSHAMTGWRIGYAIGNEETIDNMARIQQNTTSCAASFTQYAGAEAITGDQNALDLMVWEYQKRRDLITGLFNEIEGLECLNPQGAFYVFPNFTEYGLSSETLAELFLKKVGICASPGRVFGKKYDGFLKLAEFLPTIR